MSKGYILYDFIYLTFSKWQIIEVENKLVAVRGWGRGGRAAVKVPRNSFVLPEQGLCLDFGCDDTDLPYSEIAWNHTIRSRRHTNEHT